MTFGENLLSSSDKTGFVGKTIALSLMLLSGWLLVYHIFPLYDPVFPVARDISTAVQGALFALAAVVAMSRPKLLRVEAYSIIAIAMVVAGVVLTYVGLTNGSATLLVLSATLERIGMCWFQIIVSMTLIDLTPRALGICVVVAFLLSCVGQYLLFSFLPIVGVCVFAAIPFACYLLSVPAARAIYDPLKTADPPAQSAVTQPLSFLPFSHHLFICIFVFRIICGYALSFGEIDGTPRDTFLTPFFVIALALVVIVGKWLIKADTLYQISASLIIAGLLLVPLVALQDALPLVSVILSLGVSCFDIFFWYVLIATAARNPHGAISVFAWGNGVSCFGLILGAFLGRLTNTYTLSDPAMVVLITGALIWAFATYIIITLKRFSFDATIRNLVPDTAPVSLERDFKYLNQSCTCFAERYGLTPRETEVFLLLARGRSGRYIKDALVISFNTVKVHVQHIYAKLGIHTHQELIDLLEADSGNMKE
jgi:DNA-binding CsgD family transcriptional regulator